MLTIMGRELKAYFKSPIGYVCVGMFLLLSGFFFNAINIMGGSSNLSDVLANISVVFLFLVPILTMRLLSEERNQKTDQILLTAPISVVQIVLGKFLAACAVLFVTLLLTLSYLIVLAIYGGPPYAQIFGSYLGYFLMGVAFISVGLFISSLTENMAVSAVASFFILLLLFVLEWIKGAITNPAILEFINWLSITGRFQDFSIGILNIAPIIYYLSFSAIFLFLTVQVIERRRFA